MSNTDTFLYVSKSALTRALAKWQEDCKATAEHSVEGQVRIELEELGKQIADRVWQHIYNEIADKSLQDISNEIANTTNRNTA